MSACPACGRNRSQGGAERWFRGLNPRQRSSSLGGMMRWYRRFQALHQQLNGNDGWGGRIQFRAGHSHS